jgi:hypothetical protein
MQRVGVSEAFGKPWKHRLKNLGVQRRRGGVVEISIKHGFLYVSRTELVGRSS